MVLLTVQHKALQMIDAQSGPPSGAKKLCTVVALLAAHSGILTNTYSLRSADAACSFSSLAGRHHRSRRKEEPHIAAYRRRPRCTPLLLAPSRDNNWGDVMAP